MLTIDGSYLEGGGQIARTAIALSAVTREPCKIINIRKGRPVPGLKAQHLSALRAASKICNGNLKGDQIGSVEVEFYPQEISGGKQEIDVGTAGSVTLVLQTLVPVCLYAKKKTTLEIIGGTHVPFSPSSDYFQHIFCHYLKEMGIETFFQIEKFGFYPKGGGKVKFEINPIKKLKPLFLEEQGNLLYTDAWSVASDELKFAKVADRQIEGAKSVFDKFKYEHNIYPITKSKGSCLHLHTHFENCKLGADRLGEPGLYAEKLGDECARLLDKQIKSRACLDRWMADQILPFMAIAQGGKVSVAEITKHCLTNISTIEKFLPVKFKVEGKEGKPGIISI
jgi:RNA 3'-terminal phosphate cyclase (GTP)